MRKNVVETAVLATLLLGGPLTWGQQPAPVVPPKPLVTGTPLPVDANKPHDAPAPAKSKLEEMLEKALRDNPDLRLAAAKVAEAEAELNRARLLVVQKVASAYQAVEAQKAAVESAAAELAEINTAAKTGAVDRATVRAAEQRLIDAKAKLASLEAELPYLLGQQGAGVDQKVQAAWLLKDAQQLPSATYADYVRRYYLDLFGRLPSPEEMAAGVLPKSTVQGPTADRIRAALDKPFTLVCKKKSLIYIVREMSKAFQEASRGLLIKDSSTIDDGATDDEPGELSVHFDAMPFGAALEWLEDTVPGNRVVVRDYGLVMAPTDQLPPGAPLLHDFWKRVKADDKNLQPGAKDQPSKPPAGLVKGEVKEVDTDGHIRINIGKHDGLAKGDKLTVIQQESEEGRALLVGRVRVVEVGDGEAVVEPTEPVERPIRVGHKVVGIDK